MTRRATVVLAVLLGVLAPAVPASAAASIMIAGRVLDEAGHPVAGATVAGSVDIEYTAWQSFVNGIGDVLACLVSLGFACDPFETDRVRVTARTDRNGRYVLRYDTAWTLAGNAVHDVEVTAPVLVRGTAPATTTADVAYARGGTLPAFRVWLRGAALDPARGTRRRLRAGVPGALGRPVHPPAVELVQGWATVWSYGQVAHDRDVDARVAEAGTTGTRSSVTARAGALVVRYRSGVRPVGTTVRPLSRGRRCYDDDHGLRQEIDDCPLTDGRLGYPPARFSLNEFVVDLGGLTKPDAYIARGCAIKAVAASVEGVVFLDVATTQHERGVHTGSPELPVRYVRLTLGWCKPTELSVFGSAVILIGAPARLPGAARRPRPLPGAGGSRPGSARCRGADDAAAAQRRQHGGRVTAFRQLGEQVLRRGGDAFDRAVERRLGGRRGRGDRRDLAGVLECGGGDLGVGRGGLEAAQRRDVAAHAVERTARGLDRSARGNEALGRLLDTGG
jgi:hypothetical protein